MNAKFAKYDYLIIGASLSRLTLASIITLTYNESNHVKETQGKINQEIIESGFKGAKNLQKQAISTLGNTIYQKLKKEYSKKQCGRNCNGLPKGGYQVSFFS